MAAMQALSWFWEGRPMEQETEAACQCAAAIKDLQERVAQLEAGPDSDALGAALVDSMRRQGAQFD